MKLNVDLGVSVILLDLVMTKPKKKKSKYNNNTA